VTSPAPGRLAAGRVEKRSFGMPARGPDLTDRRGKRGAVGVRDLGQGPAAAADICPEVEVWVEVEPAPERDSLLASPTPMGRRAAMNPTSCARSRRSRP
jgi:hypothetical protein